MLTLREEVHRPTPIRDYRLVSTAISRYDVTIANFVGAGGTRPSEDELKQIAGLNLLRAMRGMEETAARLQAEGRLVPYDRYGR